MPVAPTMPASAPIRSQCRTTSPGLVDGGRVRSSRSRHRNADAEYDRARCGVPVVFRRNGPQHSVGVRWQRGQRELQETRIARGDGPGTGHDRAVAVHDSRRALIGCYLLVEPHFDGLRRGTPPSRRLTGQIARGGRARLRLARQPAGRRPTPRTRWPRAGPAGPGWGDGDAGLARGSQGRRADPGASRRALAGPRSGRRSHAAGPVSP